MAGAKRRLRSSEIEGENMLFQCFAECYRHNVKRKNHDALRVFTIKAMTVVPMFFYGGVS